MLRFVVLLFGVLAVALGAANLAMFLLSPNGAGFNGFVGLCAGTAGAIMLSVGLRR